MCLKAPKIRSNTEAIDEVQRELNVRNRCFPRWIDEGKVSQTDAQDRVDRLYTALLLLKEFVERIEQDHNAKQAELAASQAGGQ